MNKNMFSQKNTIVQGLALFCCFVLGLFFLYHNAYFYHDDAYITLRYAQHFLAGEGLVWNVHEYVQGYTNFFHLLCISLLGFFGIDLVIASQMIGVLAVILLNVFVYVYLQFHVNRYKYNSNSASMLWHIPLMFSLASSPLLCWSVAGLEVSLLVLLSAMAILLFIAALKSQECWQCYFGSGVFFSLAYLTHPNAVVFVLVSFLWLLLTYKARPAKNLLLFIMPCTVVFSAYAVWQYHYYGDIVPNTFYTKASGFSFDRLMAGASYVLAFIMQPPFLCIFIAVAIIYALQAGKKWLDASVAYLLGIVMFYALYIIYIGGDHMPAFRMLVPLYVPLAFLFYTLLEKLVGFVHQTFVTMLTLLIILVIALQAQVTVLNPYHEDRAALVGTIVGKYIRSAWPKHAVIALNTAGSTPYYATENTYIDMLGLNDRHIARRVIDDVQVKRRFFPGHMKGDGHYVLSRKPDFIIVGPAEGTDISQPWFLSDLEMGLDARFRQDYQKRQIMIDINGTPVNHGGLLFTYYEKTVR